jgi:alpha-tubulin suppressor-like RCC1 family protein
MDLEQRFLCKLKEYFIEKLKLLYIDRYTTIILTKEDKVYQFERDVETLLNLNKNDNSFIESKVLNELCFKQIIDFKSSDCHVIARTIDGKVYCWGENRFRVFGNGKNEWNIQYKPELNEYLSDKQIIDICCGACHSLVLTNNGELYAWGHNEKGQIGNGCNDNQLIPIKLNDFNEEKVIQISFGY